MTDIIGTAGDDVLIAPANGTVALGAGADRLTLNAHSTSVVAGQSSYVTVADFTPGQDTLILQGFGDSWDAGVDSLTLSSWQDWYDIDLAERDETTTIPSSDPRGGAGSVTRSFSATDGADGVHIDARYIVDDGYVYTSGYEVHLTLQGVSLSDLQDEPGDNLYGTEGDDLLQTDAAGDLVFGLGGNDTLTGSGNDDTLDGGLGNDRLTASGTGAALSGGAGDDVLLGLGKDVWISGGEGDDFAHLGPWNGIADGGAGNDTLEAVMTKTGVQTLTGGEGADTFSGLGFGENTRLAELRITDFNLDEDRLELTIGKVVHQIDLSHLPDGFHLNADEDGNQVLTWEGDHGTDRVVFEGLDPLPTIRLTDDDDVYRTPAGHDVIDAGAGDDTLYAFRGEHDIRLGDGNDEIWARHDAQIDGGAGNDTMHLDFGRNNVFDLVGGEGADTFSVENGGSDHLSSATIADFQAGQDQLLVNGVAVGAGALPEGLSLSEDDDGNSIVHLGETQSVTLLGVSNTSFLLLDDGTEIPTVDVAEHAEPAPEGEDDTILF